MTSRLYSNFWPSGRPLPLVWASAGCARSAPETNPKNNLTEKRYMDFPMLVPSIYLRLAYCFVSTSAYNFRSRMMAGTKTVNNVTQGQIAVTEGHSCGGERSMVRRFHGQTKVSSGDWLPRVSDRNYGARKLDFL